MELKLKDSHSQTRVPLGDGTSVGKEGWVEVDPDNVTVKALVNDGKVHVKDDGDSDEEPGPVDSGTCPVVKSDGDVCGREKPCRYHGDDS